MSSILELTPKTQDITKKQYQNIIKFCNIGFNNRRKKLIPLLKPFFTNDIISKIILLLPNKNVRIEELSVNKIIEIAKIID
jgi:16S rRNA A1518/A1519 N6-dimethyltransferase RsmA/KsgA/DIM1 with predicted DNA glycosylase/AP lyase activity